MTDYESFLKSKSLNDTASGFEPGELNPMLFPFQADIDRWSVRRGRSAIFANCGMGKTPMQLDWAFQVCAETFGSVLIAAPLAVSKQTKREGDKFGIQVNICRSQDDVKDGINITNYEMLHKFDPSVFSGIVLDESSILKSFTGKIKRQIIDMFISTPYKLACTATPAPNDYVELGNHAEFLNVMTRSEMLSMFFINDTANVGDWRLKKHAVNDFWKWMASWAVMIGKPSDLGYEDDGFILPELHIHDHVIPHHGPVGDFLFPVEAKTLSERRAARRESINERVKLAADLANGDKDQWLIWCDLNQESDMLKHAIPDAVEVKGADSQEHKENALLDFAAGNIRVLVSKPKIAGFGMNFQSCHNMAFVGLSDSYEAYYQAVRRCWRFGQESEVHAHVITGELEGDVVRNVKRKEKDAVAMQKNMVKNMADLSKVEIKQESREVIELKTVKDSGAMWDLVNGDCVEEVKKIETGSVHYSLFSPPFDDLFTYSNSERDMGNATSPDEFFTHFKYLIPELYRITMTGRLLSFHCMNRLATITKDGYIGLKDFRGSLIYEFTAAGFIFHSEVVIWKDPLVQAVRTKALGLAHKQISKDSSRCNQGLADYIITMRKPGDNPEPVSKGRGFESYIGERDEPTAQKTDNPRNNKYSHEVWQRYASPVWMDIRQTRTLNERIAREQNDEKHMCPLQLDTIERCIELWTNPGDIVFSPFAGIGSEGYSAVKMGRRSIGIELKESYFNEAVLNMRQAEKETGDKLF